MNDAKIMKKLILNRKIILLFSAIWLFLGSLFANTTNLTRLNPQIKQVEKQAIRGKVVNSRQQALAGVTIKVRGTNQGAFTDDAGNFTLQTQADNAVLTISYLGYETREVPLSEATLIVLTEVVDLLEEVVVVGFGTQRKKDLTGAITQVNAEQINNRPVANLGQALKGLIPNLNVGVSDGSPNTSTNLNIRGTTSLRYDQDDKKFVPSNGSPLILVDGIQLNFNNLNPEDIQSVTVLKDASASAIYGARAAFGVVLITTKSGKPGGSTINYSNSFQWSQATTTPDILNAYDLQDAFIKGFELQGLTAGPAELEKLKQIKAHMDNPQTTRPYYEDENGNPIWIANVNPYHEALAKSAPLQKHNLAFSGGNDKITYYTAFGYQNQAGIYKINTDKLNRYNIISNLTVKVNDWFKIDSRNNYSYKRYTEPVGPAGKGGWWAAMSQEPGRNVNMPLFTPDDSPVGRMYTDNVLSFMDYGSRHSTTDETMLFMVSPSITPIKGWNIKADLSYKTDNHTNKRIIPLHSRIEPGSWSPVISHTSPSSIYDNRERSNQYTINLYTDYTHTFGQNHNLSGLVGYNQEWYNYNDVWADKKDITNGVDFINGATGVVTAGDDATAWAVRGLFYRFSYDYKGKYLVQSNGRYDGSSRFSKETRFKFFPSFSAGWIISEENFPQNWNPYVNFLKLRGSYGSIGNQNVSNYGYLLTFNQRANLPFIFNNMRPSYIEAPNLVDAYYSWETASTVNLGVDVQLFNHFEVNFDWYRRVTSDILSDGATYPAVLGADAPNSNTGEIQSQGWELIVKYKNETNFGMGYDFALTVGDYKSKVNTYLGNSNYLLSQLYSGAILGDIWGFETHGLFQNQAEIDAVNPAVTQQNLGRLWYPGDVRYVDLNGDGEITSGNNTVHNPGDRRVIGNSTPRYQYGLNANLRYKSFDFNLFLQGVGKSDAWIDHAQYWGAGSTGTYEVYADSWTPENTNAKYPGYYSASKNRNVQTRFLESRAYLRVKNISLGYTLPHSITEQIRFKQLKVSISAFNILEFKKLPKTFDPELMTRDYPIMRSFAFGLQANF